MNDTRFPPGSVIVGVDASVHAAHAISWAARIAVDEHRPLVLLHAVPSPEPDHVAVADGSFERVRTASDLTGAARQLVHAAAADLLAHHAGLDVHEVVTIGDARSALLDAATQGAATVVVGSRGRGPVLSMLLGSVSAAVARHSACPVTVVRPHHPGRVRRGVVVGADAAPGSRPVLEAAFRIASERSLPLTVRHVLWDRRAETGNGLAGSLTPAGVDDARLHLSESLAGLGEKYPEVHHQVDLAGGSPWSSLISDSSAMDLVVVGRHDRSALGRIVHGSTSLSVVEHAECPVLVVPLGEGG